MSKKIRYTIKASDFNNLFIVAPREKFLLKFGLDSIGSRYELLVDEKTDISYIFDWAFDCKSCVLEIKEDLIPKLKHIKNNFICFRRYDDMLMLACEKEANMNILIELKLIQ